MHVTHLFLRISYDMQCRCKDISHLMNCLYFRVSYCLLNKAFMWWMWHFTCSPVLEFHIKVWGIIISFPPTLIDLTPFRVFIFRQAPRPLHVYLFSMILLVKVALDVHLLGFLPLKHPLLPQHLSLMLSFQLFYTSS